MPGAGSRSWRSPGAARTESPTAELPSTAAATPWQLAAIDLAPIDDEAASATDESLIAVDIGHDRRGGGEPAALDAGRLRDGGTLMSRAEISCTGAEVETGAVLRLLPAADVSPIAISERLAERIGADVGSQVDDHRSPRRRSPCRPSWPPSYPGDPGQPPARQGSSSTPRRSIRPCSRASTGPTPAVDGVGGSSDPASESAQSLRALLPSAVAVRELGAEPDLSMLTAGATALWIAGVAGGALAIAGLIAVCAAQQRERRGEIGVLRALGLTAGQQAGVRRGELAMITVWGAICGAAAGRSRCSSSSALSPAPPIPGAYQSIPTLPRFDFLVGGGALVALRRSRSLRSSSIAGAAAGRTARTLTLQEVEE